MNKVISLFLLLPLLAMGQHVLSLKERAVVIDQIQKDRLDNLLPQLMDDNGIYLWVLITREYNEDPVIRTMLPSTWLNARRRTILVFYRNKVENKIHLPFLDPHYRTSQTVDFDEVLSATVAPVR